MPAYFVVSLDIHDREHFKGYQKGVMKTIEPYGGVILAAGPAERLEGDEPCKAHNVIISFPTTDHCKTWISSPEYAEIKPIRLESTGDALPYLQASLDGDKPAVSGLDPFSRKFATIRGRKMAYVDEGQGHPIIFLHGNPTSSYLWRNVIPHLIPYGRCVAPDLIGMGESEKLPNSGPKSYGFVEHREYLDALFDHLGVTENVTLVLHDWGSALGFDWANRNRKRVAGIAFTEAIVRPATWDEWPMASIFEMLRSPSGEKAVLEENFFIENILFKSVIRSLGDAEKNAYRRPFRNSGEDRRPTLSWPRQIPIDGKPAEITEIVKSYADWLTGSTLPKLFINAKPGAILTGANREFVRTWSNVDEITVRGLHYVQEDSPHEMGEAIKHWRQEKVINNV